MQVTYEHLTNRSYFDYGKIPKTPNLSPMPESKWCRWHTHLTNRGYFDYGKIPKTPNLSPMPESKWRRFWDLPCISMVIPDFFSAAWSSNLRCFWTVQWVCQLYMLWSVRESNMLKILQRAWVYCTNMSKNRDVSCLHLFLCALPARIQIPSIR